MVLKLSVCSQSCSATLLWEFHFMKFFTTFHYNSFSTFIFSIDRSNAYVIHVLNT